jgi:hypothetical protein
LQQAALGPRRGVVPNLDSERRTLRDDATRRPRARQRAVVGDEVDLRLCRDGLGSDCGAGRRRVSHLVTWRPRSQRETHSCGDERHHNDAGAGDDDPPVPVGTVPRERHGSCEAPEGTRPCMSGRPGHVRSVPPGSDLVAGCAVVPIIAPATVDDRSATVGDAAGISQVPSLAPRKGIPVALRMNVVADRASLS